MSVGLDIDAKAHGNLVDDRMCRGGFVTLVEEMTAHVKRIKGMHTA